MQGVVVPGLLRLLALALVGAQVLFQLLNLPLVHVGRHGQRRRCRLFRRRLGMVLREHHGHQDEHRESGHNVPLRLFGHDAFGPDALVAQASRFSGAGGRPLVRFRVVCFSSVIAPPY
jgi:hypothetical protein